MPTIAVDVAVAYLVCPSFCLSVSILLKPLDDMWCYLAWTLAWPNSPK